MNYSTKLEHLSKRYNPESSQLVESRWFSDELTFDTDVERYVKRSMKAVDEEYTKKTKEAGEVVKDHLSRSLVDVSYKYQGSVMTNTHIKGASDIDLLVICEKFYGTDILKIRKELENSYKYTQAEYNRLRDYNSAFSMYQGNSTSDLVAIRCSIESIMKQTYAICDTTKAKAVQITNQHLHRDVDIVTSSWFQSFDYVVEGMPENKRGIKIYNKETCCSEGPDFPFLSIDRINERSSLSNGKLKRMIRFLKNVREDSDQTIALTSFDINAMCYSIPLQDYAQSSYKELVYILWKNMFHLWYDNKQDNLRSVSGDEFIFKGNPKKIDALKLLEGEVFKINKALGNL
ncbi:MAG: hypothetical protein E7121_02355 [Bacteroidales bacterium]|nr:hypothetical protein [Bacteroidales bacterium]